MNPSPFYQVRPGNLSGEVFLGLSTVAGLSLLGDLAVVGFALVCFFAFGIRIWSWPIS